MGVATRVRKRSGGAYRRVRETLGAVPDTRRGHRGMRVLQSFNASRRHRELPPGDDRYGIEHGHRRPERVTSRSSTSLSAATQSCSLPAGSFNGTSRSDPRRFLATLELLRSVQSCRSSYTPFLSVAALDKITDSWTRSPSAWTARPRAISTKRRNVAFDASGSPTAAGPSAARPRLEFRRHDRRARGDRGAGKSTIASSSALLDDEGHQMTTSTCATSRSRRCAPARNVPQRFLSQAPSREHRLRRPPCGRK